MGHTRAVDIEEDLKKGIESLQKANLLQLSMNGPNVRKVFEDLQSEIQLENGILFSKYWFMWTACHTWSI